ncbi:hypothetical protein HNR23_001279 [Nocardiopsis mwathae]|uniref:Uncharacterized protein n=1 Tax=Nocardiopsis mwathae TaxID=1472723 RepID=A0A7W9YFH9_9ACTN|nr:hypothetical protein [Nocardiopsis mwathae]MBB6171219.1 hypothetical protein [Nocardiopsis mwathae]
MSEGEDKKKRIDLSVSQVVGGGLATLGAASAASYLGVWGTIGGAAAMSVMSTVGGAVIQHFVKQSGDKAKELAERTQLAPTDREGSAAGGVTGATAVAPVTEVRGDPDATRAMPVADAIDDAATAALAMPAAADPAADAAATRAMPAVGGAAAEERSAGPDAGAVDGADGSDIDDERTWWQRWRAIVIPAAVVFVAVMAVILAIELLTGKTLSDTVQGNDVRSGPTILGGQSRSADTGIDVPDPGATPDTGGQDGGTTQHDGATPDPGTGGTTDRNDGTDGGTDGGTGGSDGSSDGGTGETGGETGGGTGGGTEHGGTGGSGGTGGGGEQGGGTGGSGGADGGTDQRAPNSAPSPGAG